MPLVRENSRWDTWKWIPRVVSAEYLFLLRVAVPKTYSFPSEPEQVDQLEGFLTFKPSLSFGLRDKGFGFRMGLGFGLLKSLVSDFCFRVWGLNGLKPSTWRSMGTSVHGFRVHAGLTHVQGYESV